MRKNSLYTDALLVSTLPLILDAPTFNTNTGLSYDSVTINWNSVANAEGYKVHLYNVSDSLIVLNDVDIGNVTTYNLTGLYQNTDYLVKIKAYNNTQMIESVYSADNNFTTTDFVILPPTFNANTDLNQFGTTINWNTSTNATAYLIYVENLDIATVVMNDVNIGNVLTYTLDTLDPATNYLVKIKAYNPIETSSYSLDNTFTTYDPTPQFSPTMLTSSPITYSSINFRWTSVTYADTYEIEVYSDIGLTSLIFSESGIVATEKTVTGLTSSTPYYARTRATNESGSSPWSSGYLTTTYDPIPVTPTMTTSTEITSTSIKFNWNNVTYADSYAIEVYSDIGLTTLVFSESGITANYKTVTGLTENTPYYARVNAINESGTSSWSTTNTTSTLGDLQKDSYTSAFYTFNGNFDDSSGSNNHGTGINSPSFGDPLLSGDASSLILNGVNQAVQIPSGVSTSRNMTIRGLFNYLSFTRPDTLLYVEWYGQAANINYIPKIYLGYNKSINKFYLHLHDQAYIGTYLDSNYIELQSETYSLSNTDKIYFLLSWDNDIKTLIFAVNNTQLTMTKVSGGKELSNLNLKANISGKPIYWGAFTYPDGTTVLSQSPNMILARLAIDNGIARDLAYHQQDYSNISSRL